MMRKVVWNGIPFPRMYAVSTDKEAREARRLGVPYVKVPSSWSMEKVVKAVLYSWLKRHWPGVNWRALLGRPEPLKVQVPRYQHVEDGWQPRSTDEAQPGAAQDTMQVADGYRWSPGEGWSGELDEVEVDEHPLDEWLDEEPNFEVRIEELQQLNVLPHFLGEIKDAISSNLNQVAWADGWSKKYDCNLGSYSMAPEARNLIILDVSASIPSSISSTMVCLIDTLRTQANADLIITAGTSRWWARGEELPSPEELSVMVGSGNESEQFNQILRDHVLGRRWGNVVVFGDYDCPDWRARYEIPTEDKAGTTVGRVLGFHTRQKVMPGYGKWTLGLVDPWNIEYDIDWVREVR